jgi:hypothetical protein
MHDLQLREANRLARKPLDPSAKEKILVLYFLGISLADDMLFFRDEFRDVASIDCHLCRRGEFIRPAI